MSKLLNSAELYLLNKFNQVVEASGLKPYDVIAEINLKPSNHPDDVGMSPLVYITFKLADTTPNAEELKGYEKLQELLETHNVHKNEKATYGPVTTDLGLAYEFDDRVNGILTEQKSFASKYKKDKGSNPGPFASG